MTISVSRIAGIPLRYLKALVLIFTSPKLILLCVIPYIIGIAAFAGSIGLSFSYKENFAEWIVGGYASWLVVSFEWLSFLIGILLSGVIGILCMLLLGGFFIECLIENVLRKRGFNLPEHESIKILIRSVTRGLRDDVVRLIYIVFLIVISIICGFIPVLFFIPPILAAFLVGFDLIDLPLTLLEHRFRDRWIFIKQNLLEVVALGAVFSVIMLVPLGGIVFLPVAYVVAVEQLTGWDLTTPTSSNQLS